MTSIQIASDLHIECYDGEINPLDFITPTADILILAGDIGSLYKLKQLTRFVSIICGYFQVVIYIPGNHEYYTVENYTPLTFSVLENRMIQLGTDIANLHILNRNSIRINNLCILGCTLWSRPTCLVPNYIVRIPDWCTDTYLEQHEKDLLYITQMIEHCKERHYKLLVITHHTPTYKVLEGTTKRKKYLSLYSSDLDHLLDKEMVTTWICGHIHKNFDFITDKGCRIVSNQRGKSKDKITDYSKKFIINI